MVISTEKVFRLKTNKKLSPRKLESTIIYDDKIARRATDTRYYEAMADEIQSIPWKDEERKRYASRKRKKVTLLLNKYKRLVDVKAQGVFNKLYKIYEKNCEAARRGLEPPMHTKLLYLASSYPVLLTAYKTIRKNKGATSLAYMVADNKYFGMNTQQKSFLNKTFNAPDGLTKEVFIEVSKMLRKGTYPWGTSRRIYIPKPGRPTDDRPITIPPFMDRVVQKAIYMVLEAIYEPWFEKYNCSFGFRPFKGVHDAICALTSTNTRGLDKAIEGDVKGAFPSLNHDTLIQLLQKRIKDKKFLNLIRNRMQYVYFDTKLEKYVDNSLGTQQGGIDSPYIWNIYMMELDKYVINNLQKRCDDLNTKLLITSKDNGDDNHVKEKYAKPRPTNRFRKINDKRVTLNWIIKICNKFPNQYELIEQLVINNTYDCLAWKEVKANNRWSEKGYRSLKELGYRRAILKEYGWQEFVKSKRDTNEFKNILIKESSKLKHQMLNNNVYKASQKRLRIFYIRYADDWILLTNAPTSMVEGFKQDIGVFLKDNLQLTLGSDKTLITDLRYKKAHFLGFELGTPANSKVGSYVKQNNTKVTGKTAGKYIYALPDRQRLINRFHMKGYCTPMGFPKEIPWLSCLEPHMIIERFNAVIQGLVNFYAEFIKTPNKQLARWIYILRYSCIKTLAQKYKTSIRKIFIKFKNKSDRDRWRITTEKTIACEVSHVIDSVTYSKKWQLLTLAEAILKAKAINRKNTVVTSYNDLRKGLFVKYDARRGTPPITTDDYLDKIMWVNLRSQASFDLPCSMCGSDHKVEMHHIKHIRKVKYNDISSERSWERVMSLRNRKQIPVCRECHIHVIHKGKYGGTKLGLLTPKVMYDNRLITIESYIHKGRAKNYIKTLEQRGWKRVTR